MPGRPVQGPKLRIEGEASRQGWLHGVGRPCDRGLGRDGCNEASVHEREGRRQCIGSEGVGVRPCDAGAAHGRWAITDPVTIGVGVPWIGPGVGAVDVDACVGLDAVVEPVPIVIGVGDQPRCRSDRIVRSIVARRQVIR